MGLGEEVLFRLGRELLKRREQAESFHGDKDDDAYRARRDSELRAQFDDNFDIALLAGKDVLDFGCGSGELSLYVAERGARSVIGTELDADRVRIAGTNSAAAAIEPKPLFIQADDPKTVPLADNCIDVLLCFDVAEHIMAPEAVLREWARVLRPGGRALIWWMPWAHPFGHHYRQVMPVPYAHLMVDEDCFMRLCNRLYNAPEYDALPHQRDASGAKIPDLYEQDRMETWLNKLSTRDFETMVQQAGLTVAERRLIPLKNGSGLGKMLGPLTHWSHTRDLVTAVALYTLEKPDAE
ncbi:MAG: methyltransferase domain-containing protein [Neomegalonema sp.]|nr:methyltransferase domain-containing protein [Neomegalonema sp.]